MVLTDILILYLAVVVFVGKLGVVPSRRERLALAALLFLAVKSVHIYVLIALGFQPVLTAQIALGVPTLLLAVLWKRRAMGFWGPSSAAEIRHDGKKIRGATVLLAALSLLAVIVAWVFPITEPDALWYQVRGLLYYHEAGFDHPDVFHNEYSPFIPLLHSYAESLGWEHAKAMFPVFYIALLVIFYHRLLASLGDHKAASLATLMLGTTPYFWWHGVLPFLNLPAAVFFVSGVFFWADALREIWRGPWDRPRGEAPDGKLFLAGLLLGLAAWCRLEFLFYGLFLLAGLWYGQASARVDEDGRRVNLASFIVPYFLFASLWMLTVLLKFGDIGFEGVSLLLVCGAGWLCLAFLHRITFVPSVKVMLIAVAAGIVLYLPILVWKGLATVGVPQQLLLNTYRTFAYLIFFSFTAGLAVFPFLERWSDLDRTERMLACFMMFYLAAHFMIYSLGKGRWETLGEYFRMTFIQPGNTANSSGAREYLAFIPILVYFVFHLPRIRAAFRS